MLMQAVSVYPHHHHAHILCLGQEMESTRPVKSTHACTSECITHFQLTIPSSGSCFSHKKAVSRPPLKQLHAIILLWLCMLMQAVSVYPHHHHAHILCLGQEMESTRPVKSTHACTSECITHFQLTIPSSGSCFSHKKAVSRPPFILWAACDLSAIHTLQISRRPYNAYRPDLYLSRPIGGKGILYLSRPIGGKGMRAPPRA